MVLVKEGEQVSLGVFLDFFGLCVLLDEVPASLHVCVCADLCVSEAERVFFYAVCGTK